MVLQNRLIQALGFVGLGVMGEPMCRHLIQRSGLPIYGCDLDPLKTRGLVQEGMISCASPSEVASSSGIVFLCLTSSEQVQNVCFGAEGLLRSSRQIRAIVDCGTTSVEHTRLFAAACAEEGIAWIDAPIARGREAAREGTLSIMVGAEPELFAALEPLLRCMGTSVTRCGPTGSGQIVKILNNKVMVQTVHALAEALAIARTLGVDGTLMFNVFADSSADSRALRNQGMRALLPGHFPRSAFPTLYAQKDLRLALALANEAEIDASLLKATDDILGRAAQTGHAHDYWPVLIKALERTAQPPNDGCQPDPPV